VHSEGSYTEHDITVGAGAGLEFYLWRLTFSIMVGLAPRFSKSDEYQDWSTRLMVSPEGGVYFRF
jgi:hypothetical protein